MSLSYEEAERVLAAALAKAKELSIVVGISVADDKGHAVATARMTGARVGTDDASLGKAKVSALYEETSGAVANRLPTAISQSMAMMHGGRLVYWQGAVPIKRGDVLVGAIGVGGSSSENDELVAQAGADAF